MPTVFESKELMKELVQDIIKEYGEDEIIDKIGEENIIQKIGEENIIRSFLYLKFFDLSKK